MAATFATQAARRAGTKVVTRVELVGQPWKIDEIDNGGDDGDGSTAYSVLPLSFVSAVPENYSARYKNAMRPILKSVSFSADTVDPTTGAVKTGGCSIQLQDFNNARTYTGGSPEIALTGRLALTFAPGGSSLIGHLGANLTRTATSLSMADSVQLTAGTAYWIGREMIVASSTSDTPTIVRGDPAAKSRQWKHDADTAAERHEDGVYDGPITWIGQEVNIYFGFDHPDLDQDDEIGPLRYVVSRPPTRRADGTWELQCESALRMVAKRFGAGRFEGRLINGRSDNGDDRRIFLPGASIQVVPTTTDIDTVPSFSATDDDVYLQIGESFVRASVVAGAAQPSLTQMTVQEIGLYGQRTQTFASRLDGPVSYINLDLDDEVHEFIPTDERSATPRIGHVASAYGGALVASSHPIVAFLCLLLSRDGVDGDAGSGSDRNTESGEHSYDVLPPPWGVSWPAEWTALDSFQALIDEYGGALFRGFKLGLKGGESLLKWWEREVARFLPFGLYIANDGRLTAFNTGDVFPLDEGITVTLSDFEKGYYDYSLGSSAEMGRTIYRYGLRDGTAVMLNTSTTRAQELFPDEVQVTEAASEGIDDESAAITLQERGAWLLSRAALGAPTITVNLPMRYIETALPGARMTVTDPSMPNPDGFNSGGAYGVTSDDGWKILSRKIISPAGKDEGVQVTARRQQYRTGHHGPAATVSGWVSGTRTLTLSANDYTPASTSSAVVPTDDVLGFGADGSQGSTGLHVEVYTKRGVRATDAQRIETISAGGNTIVVATAFTAVGGGAYSVTAGDVLRVARYTDTIAASSTSPLQDDWLTMGAGSPPLVNTDDAAYRWGG